MVDADASVTVEASPCGDTQSTAANCGYCGHDCLGGACVKGACQPFALLPVDAGASPIGLAQDEKYLYWTDNYLDNIMRTDKGTPSSVAVSQGAGLFLAAIVADEGGLFWGDQFYVSTCTLSAGCAASTAVVSRTSQSAVVSMAVDSNSVYWSEGSSAVLRASRTGTQQTALTLWQGDASVEHVATDGRRVYFTAVDGLLRFISVDGGAAIALGVPSAHGSFDVTVDHASVYWSVIDPAQGAIDRAPLDTLSATTLATQQTFPPSIPSIASDGTSLYWIAGTSRSNETAIMSCTIASCTPQVLATIPASNLSAIVVDSVAIYVVQPGAFSGAIWKLAK